MLPINAEVEVKNRLPQWRQIHKVTLLAQIFLGDLKLYDYLSPSQVSEQGRWRFPDLEINRTVLDLDQHVVLKHIIKSVKKLNSSIGAVILPVRFVEVMVIDKGTVHDNSVSMRLEGPGKQIGSVSKRTTVRQRTRLALRVRLDQISQHVRNILV